VPPSRFKVQQRFQEFSGRFRHSNLFTLEFGVYITGWILFFYVVMLSISATFAGLIIPFIILGLIGRKIIRETILSLDPPSEILLLLLLILVFFEKLWFGWFIDINLLSTADNFFPSTAALIPQIFLLSLITLLLSLLLVQNNNGKSRVLLTYLFLGFASLFLLKLSDRYFWIIFQLIMIFVLFRQTTWAEKLTRLECLIYFVVIGTVLVNYQALPYLSISNTTVNSFGWYFLPAILSHFIKLYLYAILLKIPFVIVYHHARLRRKFKIAGWLQSSIPQFIQLVILLLVFYFFIGGWQAENLKTAIINQIKIDSTGTLHGQSKGYFFQANEYPFRVILPGYRPFDIPGPRIKTAVVWLQPRSNTAHNTSNYFLYSLLPSQGPDNIHLVRIDSLFLDNIRTKLVTIAASGLMAYPFKVNQWDSLFYKMSWMFNKRFADIQVFPFALTPYSSEQAVAVDLKETPENQSKETAVLILHQDKFTAGRVFLPLLNTQFRKTGLWAFDIILIPKISSFRSPLMQQVGFWLLIYLVINLLVIRRVITFGNRITDMIVQKFNQLTAGIRQISDGNLDYKIHMEGQDEFVELAGRFNQMGDELQKKIAEVREKDRLEYELRIARDVQLSLLPRQLPEIPGYRLAANIRTAAEVGGDFYDVLPLEEDKFLLVIGDVSGKGTSAAFYMAQCISMIRFARQFAAQPRDIMIRLNRYFSDPMIDRQIFVTAVIGLLDSRKNTLQFLRAGHNPPLYVPAGTAGEIKELQAAGLGLGLERKGALFEKTLKAKSLRFNKGDLLFLYTDGLVEASSYHSEQEDLPPRTDFFGEERLIKILNEQRGKSVEEIMAVVNREIREFYGNSPLIDDMTMLVIRRSEN
jgi:serine phosphatase RsbU (regulator of sigma subunit)